MSRRRECGVKILTPGGGRGRIKSIEEGRIGGGALSAGKVLNAGTE